MLLAAGLVAGSVPLFAAETNSTFYPLKAGQLIGMSVENEDGQTLGRLCDLVLDPQTGRIRFALVSSGGFFGIGARIQPVPAQALSTATTLRNTLAVDVSEDRWAQAPDIKISKLDSLTYGSRAREIAQFYGEAPPAAAEATPPGAPGTTGKPTGQSGGLRLASSYIGRRVVNRQKDKIGEIRDLLVDLSGRKPAFAVVSTGRLLHRRLDRYAIAVRALRPQPGSRKLLADLSRQTLQQAGVFDERAWQEPAGADVFRYSDAEEAARPNPHSPAQFGDPMHPDPLKTS